MHSRENIKIIKKKQRFIEKLGTFRIEFPF